MKHLILAAACAALSLCIVSAASATGPTPTPLPTGHWFGDSLLSPLDPFSVIPVVDSPAWPRWEGDRLLNEHGHVWLNDRNAWWNPASGYYWINGYWRDGQGRFWDDVAGWRVWDDSAGRWASSHRVAGFVATGTGVERWRPLVAAIFPAHTVEKVLRVMHCESRGDPDVTSWAGARGLMQVMPQWHQAKADALFGPGASLYDPWVNLNVAAVISGYGSSWAAWDCRWA